MPGRKKKLDPPKRLTSKLPTSLLEAFEEALIDPGTGRIPQGARQAQLIRLLRQWLRGQDGLAYYQHVDRFVKAVSLWSYNSAEANDMYRELARFHANVVKSTDLYNRPQTEVDLSEPLG